MVVTVERMDLPCHGPTYLSICLCSYLSIDIYASGSDDNQAPSVNVEVSKDSDDSNYNDEEEGE